MNSNLYAKIFTTALLTIGKFGNKCSIVVKRLN